MAQEKILGEQINLLDLNSLLTTNLITDLTPQLGGNLDLNGFKIIDAGDIQLLADGASADIRVTGIYMATVTGNVRISSGDEIRLASSGGSVLTLSNATKNIELRGDTVTLTPDSFNTTVIEFFKPTEFKTVFGRAPAIAADTTFTLPSDNGTSGFLLSSDGTGVTSWVTPPTPNNWITAHNGADFAIAPAAGGSPASPNAIAIGNAAVAIGNSTIAIGTQASATNGAYSLAIGTYSNSSHYSTVCVGHRAYSGAAYQTNVGVGISSDATAYRSTFGYGAFSAMGVTGSTQSLVSLVDSGKCELYGDKAMFVAPQYVKASLPAVVAGGMIYVTDAVTGPGSPPSTIGVQCFGRGTGSPAGEWIDVITGLAVV